MNPLAIMVWLWEVYDWNESRFWGADHGIGHEG